MKFSVIPAEAGIQMFRKYGSLLLQGQVWIPAFTGITTWIRRQKNLFKELKGLSFLRKQESRNYPFVFMDSKGISVIFLMIAMLLMVTIGYVFSYLIPSKQKSVVFPIQSTQAFFLAQSGVEYAVRYATDQGWGTTAALLGLNGVTVRERTLGAGRFYLTYTDTTDILVSDGYVPTDSLKRSISVSHFTQFLGPRSLVLWTPDPCVERNNNQRVDFYIRNDGTLPVVLNSFSGHWEDWPPWSIPELNRIYINGTEKYRNNGGYSSDEGQVNFNRNPSPPGISTFTFNPGDTFMVQLRFDADARGMQNVLITFYDTDGNPYQFNLGTLQRCP